MYVIENNKTIRQFDFNLKNGEANAINKVFKDSLGTTWFFTEKDIIRLKKESSQPEYLFSTTNGNSPESYSYSVLLETKKEIWFGGKEGRLMRFIKESHVFSNIPLSIKDDILRIEFLTGNKIFISLNLKVKAYLSITIC